VRAEEVSKKGPRGRVPALLVVLMCAAVLVVSLTMIRRMLVLEIFRARTTQPCSTHLLASGAAEAPPLGWSHMRGSLG
jgi:hypothetical protein